MAGNGSRKRPLKTYLWEDLQANEAVIPRRTRLRHKKKQSHRFNHALNWDGSADSGSSDDVEDVHVDDIMNGRHGAINSSDFPSSPSNSSQSSNSAFSHSDSSSCSDSSTLSSLIAVGSHDHRVHDGVRRDELEVDLELEVEDDTYMTSVSGRDGDDFYRRHAHDDGDSSDTDEFPSVSDNSESEHIPESDCDESDLSESDYTGPESNTSSCSEQDTAVGSCHRNESDRDDDFRSTREPRDDGSEAHLDEWLYPGAQITRKESLLLTMAHFLRHNLTQEALGSLLQLLQFHLPAGTSFPASKYIFNQHFDGFCGPLQCHVYCSSCKGYVGTESGLCTNCGLEMDYDDNISKGNYFLVFSVAKQIKFMLEDPNIQSKISRDGSDLCHGICYKQLPMKENDISVTWGSDGAAVFSSSNFSIWPLLLMINELPYSLRRKHILMGGLWFGSGKPHFPTFLKPVVEEMNSLSSEGISWEDETKTKRTTRVFPGPLTCDSVARCQLQDISQFNGRYGCSWCLHAGEHVKKGNGYTRVYPMGQLDHLPPKRDEASFKEDAREAVETNQSVNGVKGPSMILLLLHFNIISGFVVDYMHSVCLGVARTLTFLWLESTGMPCYIGNKIGSLNERLSQCIPSAEITRLTRTLTQRKYWKAHEWRSWLFHYSPLVLYRILPTAYYQHWMCFVTALYLLMQEVVDQSCINKAELLLTKFVIDCEVLYGKEYVTYNMHQLIHIADSVRNWGPLWSISCFSFESMNHKLNKMISGTQYVQKQISRKFLLSRILPHIGLDCFDENQEAQKYFELHINRFQSCPSAEMDLTGMLLKGCQKLIKVGRNEAFHLLQVGYTQEIILSYNKVSFKGSKITTDKYERKKRKRIDYYVSLTDGRIAVVKGIFLVCLSCNQATCCCKKQCMLYLSVLRLDRSFFNIRTPELSVTHEGLKKIKGHKEYSLCKLSDFNKKCLYARFGNDEFVSVLPNNVELD